MGEEVWGNAFIQEIRLALAKRLLQAGIEIQSQAKRDYSISNPRPHKNPAPKGTFPRGRTWNLRDSIAIAPNTLPEISRELKIRVGYLPGAKYGAILAAKGWKGILDSYAKVAGLVNSVLQGQ